MSGFVVGALGGWHSAACLGHHAGRPPSRSELPHATSDLIVCLVATALTWFGYGELAKLVFISLSTLYPVALGYFEGVRGVTREHLEVARVYRLHACNWFLRLILPLPRPRSPLGSP